MLSKFSMTNVGFFLKSGVLSCALCLTFSACSSDDSSDDKTVLAPTVDYTIMEGMYDTSSTDGDENYLYIDADGLITSYNWMGDIVDNGGNCYNISQSGDVNYALNGLSLTRDETNSKYYTTVSSTEVAWTYDSSDTITSIVYGGSITATSRLALNNMVLVTAKTSSPTLSDITNNMCP